MAKEETEVLLFPKACVLNFRSSSIITEMELPELNAYYNYGKRITAMLRVPEQSDLPGQERVFEELFNRNRDIDNDDGYYTCLNQRFPTPERDEQVLEIRSHLKSLRCVLDSGGVNMIILNLVVGTNDTQTAQECKISAFPPWSAFSTLPFHQEVFQRFVENHTVAQGIVAGFESTRSAWESDGISFGGNEGPPSLLARLSQFFCCA